VSFRFEFKSRRFAYGFDHRVVFGAAAQRHRGVGQVGNIQQQLLKKLFLFGQRLFELLDAIAHRAHFRHHFAGIAALFLDAGNLFGGLIAMVAQLFDFGQHGTALRVGLGEPAPVDLGAAVGKGFLYGS